MTITIPGWSMLAAAIGFGLYLVATDRSAGGHLNLPTKRSVGGVLLIILTATLWIGILIGRRC